MVCPSRMNPTLQRYVAVASSLVEVMLTEPSSGAGRGPQSIATQIKKEGDWSTLKEV